MHLDPWLYPLLFFVGLLAGWVDSIAGGGGLIALPALLNLGLPVPLALGTNKFQSTWGALSATWHYIRSGLVDFRECRIGIIATLVGAALGALAVQQIDSHQLGRVVPWLLAALLLYTAFRPQVGTQDHPPRIAPHWFYLGFGLGFGFYDGFFGPGVGSFWALSLILLLGQNFARATAHTKVMNLTSNVVSLVLFASAGLVNYGAGFVMGVGQVVGARLGAKRVVKHGANFVRPVFLTVVTLILLRLIWLNYR